MATVNDVKKAVAVRQVRPMSPAVAEVRTGINLMVEVMKSVMKDKVHFGVIPGVEKPSLFKAGAEKIMATFRLSADPKVEDLSHNGEIRYRVKVEVKAKDGSFVGAGIGECSSGEEKYMWRAAVCQKEFDITQEDRRRIKFKKAWKSGEQVVDEIPQVRVNPSDMANTILKMAKKRALVDAVLTSTGASDIFSQDIEDLPEEYVHSELAKVVDNPPKSADTNERVATQETQSEEQPSPEASQEDRGLKSLLNANPNDVVLEFQGLVTSVSSRDVKCKDGKIKPISAYHCEDTQGNAFVIENWGSPQQVEGAICTFIEIKVGEYKGEKKFLAKKVVVNG